MKHTTLLGILLCAVFLLSASALASNFSMGFGFDGLQIEVNRGDGWNIYAGNPYSYTYDDWYYFDYPYRYQYNGSYYNFNPGWYYYEPSWQYDPYNSYSYYPQDYYPYNGNWYYDPSWYNPGYQQTYNYLPYISGSGVQVSAQSYNCANVNMHIGPVRVEAGKSVLVDAAIKNNTDKRFEVSGMEVYIDSFGLHAEEIRTPEYVAADSKAYATFRLYADSDAKADRISANVKVSGRFRGANYCNYSDVGVEYFDIYIKALPYDLDDAEEEQPEPAETVSTIVYRPSTWAYSEATTSTSTTAQQGTISLAPVCSGLDLQTHSITVQSSEKQYEELQNPQILQISESADSETFWLKNYSTENFYIDSVDVHETSNNISLGTGLSDSVVYKNDDFGKVTLVVNAFPVMQDDYTKAIVGITGHFANGTPCSLSGEFYVYVNTDQQRCGGLKLEVPNEMKFEKDGVVTIKIDNPLAESATVTISAEGASVYPGSITLPKETYAERLLYVALNGNANAVLTYRAFSGNCSAGEMVTFVKYAKPEELPRPAISIEGFPQEIEVEDSKKFTVVVKNNSEEYATVRADVTGLPRGFYSRASEQELAPGNTAILEVEVLQNSAEAGEYNAKIAVTSGGTLVERPLKIILKGGEIAAGTENAGTDVNETAAGGNGNASAGSGNIVEALGSAAGTAMVVLGDNAINIGIAILVLVVIYAMAKAYSGRKGKAEEPPKLTYTEAANPKEEGP